MTGEKTVSVDDQKTTIEALLSKDKMAVDDKYYVVSWPWFVSWMEYTGASVGGGPAPVKGGNGKAPGPIDNSALVVPSTASSSTTPATSLSPSRRSGSASATPGSPVSPPPPTPKAEAPPAPPPPPTVAPPAPPAPPAAGFQTLKTGIAERADYTLVSAAVWSHLHAWYGGGPALPRTVVPLGVKGDVRVELYPMRISIRKVGSQNPVKNLIIARSATLSQLRKLAAGVLGFGELEAHKLKMYFAPDHDTGSGKIALAGDADEQIDDAGVEPGNLILFKLPGIAVATPATPTSDDEEEEEPKGLIRSGASRLQALFRGGSSSKDREDKRSSSTGGGWLGRGGGHVPGKPAAPGVVGLQNLGNTCFMNSGLQCMLHTPALTNYLIADKHVPDLNPSNPLGMKGMVAKEYAQLCKDMWSGDYRVLVPRGFKSTIGRFAPQFAGYAQQDAQELLSFLLDGLHEDMNRVRKKPYVENPEGDEKSDQKKLAQESWDKHRLRNDSIVVDTFQGQYRSTVECPDCGRVSVVFDPFTFLSLPVPQRDSKQVVCEVYRAGEGTDVQPMHYGVMVPNRAAIFEVKSRLAKLMGKDVDVEKLVVFEDWNNSLHPQTDRSHVGGYRGKDKNILRVWEIPDLDSDGRRKASYTYWSREDPKDFTAAVVFRYKDNDVRYKDYEKFGRAQMVHFHAGTKYSVIRAKIEAAIAPFVVKGAKYTLEWGEYSAKDSVLPDDDEVFTPLHRHQGHNPTFAVTFEDITVAKASVVNPWEGKEPRNHESMTAGQSEKEETPSLYSCLDSYVTTEVLTKENAWYCSVCKKHQEATKSMKLWRLPDVLVCHFKRFKSEGWLRQKIDGTIEFPMEGLDMSAFTADGSGPGLDPLGKSTKYNLIGVVNHSGGLGGGHYTAYGKSHIDNKWYDFNDSHTSPANEARIVGPAAYVLFYQRV